MHTSQLSRTMVVASVLLVNLILAGLALSFTQQETSFTTSQSSNIAVSSVYDDEFNGPAINPNWYWYNENPLHWSLSESPGKLQITSTEGDWVDACEPDVENVLLLQPDLQDYVLTTKLDFNPTNNFQQAGIVVFEDNYTRLKLSAVYNDEQFSGQIIEFVMVLDGVRTHRYNVAADLTQTIYLKFEKFGNTYTGYYSYDNNTFSAFPQVTAPEFSQYNVGLYANNSCYYDAPDIPAKFDYIHVTIPCEVPFFWQRDPDGINNHPLRGTCGINFDTLGEGGCTLTSATMLFRYYGASTTISNTEMTPPNLSDCMGTKACPFSWVKGATCSNGQITYLEKAGFNYDDLSQKLNQEHRPVILKMCTKPTCYLEIDADPHTHGITHWVLVVGGQGNDPANYTIWDPWFECGQNMRLNSRSDKWDFIEMAVYDGTPTCSFPIEVPSCALSISPVPLPSVANATIAKQDMAPPAPLTASSNITGTAVLYRTTDVTMTVHLTAQSSVGNVTDMLIWSDTISNITWQPFAPYVWLPLSDFVYAQFRDDKGNISTVVSDTPNPSAPPVAPDPERVYLPLATR